LRAATVFKATPIKHYSLGTQGPPSAAKALTTPILLRMHTEERAMLKEINLNNN
jgi:hypothetical protein